MEEKRNDEQWRNILSPEEYRIMRTAGTEPPFSGQYDLHFEDGIYSCKGCKATLFDSLSKFDSGCGWPSFDHEISKGRIKEKVDNSHSMSRTEIVCANCESHLGHVFNDGPTESGLRYCVNSASLNFHKEEEK